MASVSEQFSENTTNEDEGGTQKCCCVTLSKKISLFFSYVIPPVVGLIGDVSDVTSDCLVSYRHYVDGKVWHCALTLTFMFLPSILFAFFMLYQIMCRKDLNALQKVGRIIVFLMAAFLLSLWPIIRYFKMLVYGIKIFCDITKKDQYLSKFQHMQNDSNSKLQVQLHAFLASAPQFLLQLYILLSNPPMQQTSRTVTIQIISIMLSLNSLTSVVLSFQLDSKHHPRTDVDKCFIPIEFLWWFLSIGARISALAFFAAVFRYWVILVCILHAAVMSGFIMFHQRQANCGDRIVAVFVGLMYIFCFVEYKVDFGQLGRVVALYVLYYVFTFLQNSSMVICSYLMTPVTYDFHLILLVLHFVAFFLGIMFMLCYLTMLRPVKLKIEAESGDRDGAEHQNLLRPIQVSELEVGNRNEDQIHVIAEKY